MTAPLQRLGQRTLAGGARVLAAEALALPTMLATAALLTRRLGPERYGLLILAAALTGWIEWGVHALFSRATVKLVAEAADWRPVGGAIVRLNLLFSAAAAAGAALAAQPVAALFNEPQLAPLLRLFALDVPLFCLAQIHRSILVALGRFTERAYASVVRWTVRLVLIVTLVELGLSIEGAILGAIGASLAELIVSHCAVRPQLLSRAPLPLTGFWDYAAPLLASAVALGMFDRMDLLALKTLGGPASQVGNYGAAQNLVSVAGLLSGVLAPLALSSLTRLFAAGAHARARELTRQLLRLVLLTPPFAALVSGAAPAIVALAFGQRFELAGEVLRVLAFAGAGDLMIAAAMTTLVAAGRPRLTLALVAPLPFVSLAAQLIVIPRLGPIGAAIVTTVGAVGGAIAAVAVVRRVVGVAPPAATLLRSVVVGAACFAAARLWPAWGPLLLVKLAVLSLAVGAGFLALGEFSRTDLERLRSVLPRERPAAG